jgi:predicted KAP-like P-loop ATPase
MLAQSDRVNGNPRIVKRLMNVVRMRSSIARKRGMDLDDGVIAKLALFERCTDGQSVEALHYAINSAGDGRPELLAAVEGSKTEDELRKISPEPWKKHAHTILDWSQLEPKLAGIDLRSAVYLARETVPLRIGISGLSADTRSAIEGLMKTGTLGSTAAAEAANRIPAADRVRAMEEIVAAMRKNPDWSRNRSDFRGAIILARSSPEAGLVLSRFIRSLQARPKWMGPILSDEDWAEIS